MIWISAWIEDKYIKKYAEYKDELVKSSKSAAFKEAVQKIDEFISDPVVSVFIMSIMSMNIDKYLNLNLIFIVHLSKFRNSVQMPSHRKRTMQKLESVNLIGC